MQIYKIYSKIANYFNKKLKEYYIFHIKRLKKRDKRLLVR